jgi:hypothetical protein
MGPTGTSGRRNDWPLKKRAVNEGRRGEIEVERRGSKNALIHPQVRLKSVTLRNARAYTGTHGHSFSQVGSGFDASTGLSKSLVRSYKAGFVEARTAPTCLTVSAYGEPAGRRSSVRAFCVRSIGLVGDSPRGARLANSHGRCWADRLLVAEVNPPDHVEELDTRTGGLKTAELGPGVAASDHVRSTEIHSMASRICS